MALRQALESKYASAEKLMSLRPNEHSQDALKSLNQEIEQAYDELICLLKGGDVQVDQSEIDGLNCNKIEFDAHVEKWFLSISGKSTKCHSDSESQVSSFSSRSSAKRRDAEAKYKTAKLALAQLEERQLEERQLAALKAKHAEREATRQLELAKIELYAQGGVEDEPLDNKSQKPSKPLTAFVDVGWHESKILNEHAPSEFRLKAPEFCMTQPLNLSSCVTSQEIAFSTAPCSSSNATFPK